MDMNAQKIGLLGVVCAIGCVGYIPNAAATQWKNFEAQFSCWVAEHGVEFPDEVSHIRGELRYLQEMEKRNPWDNLLARLSEKYSAIAEGWLRPVRLMFLKEGFTGTREEWQAKHRRILSFHLKHLRDLSLGNAQELDALIALVRTTDEPEKAESAAERPIAAKEPSEDIYVDQASLLEEDIRRMEAMNAQFLWEKFSLTDEQIEQFRTIFGQIYDELVGDL
jgi:hypothetical protein